MTRHDMKWHENENEMKWNNMTWHDTTRHEITRKWKWNEMK